MKRKTGCLTTLCLITTTLIGMTEQFAVDVRLATSPQEVLQDIEEISKQEGNIDIFLKLLKQVGLENLLVSNKTYTLFVPTDEAFKKLSKPERDYWFKHAKQLISYHLVPAKIPLVSLKAGYLMTLLPGKKVFVHPKQGNIYINQSKIISPDLITKNAITYLIDKVLIP